MAAPFTVERVIEVEHWVEVRVKASHCCPPVVVKTLSPAEAIELANALHEAAATPDPCAYHLGCEDPALPGERFCGPHILEEDR
jgi:hypothetical protein